MTREPFIFSIGDRVKLCERGHVYNGAVGTITDPPPNIKETFDWTSFRKIEPRDFGSVLFYWVKFDSSQSDEICGQCESMAVAVQHLVPVSKKK
jgi:hypothetical protein